MKTRNGSRLVEWLVMPCMIALLAAMATGCTTNKKIDAILAQTNMQAQRQGITESVLSKLADKGNGVVADTLANMEPGGAAVWFKGKRAIRTSANEPVLVNGVPQFEEMEGIAKSRSGREFASVTKGVLTMFGLPRDKDGSPVLNAIPDLMRVEIEASGGNVTVNTEWAKVWGDAVAAEKTAIIAGMGDLATKRGAAWAVKFTAASNGLVSVMTGMGEVVGKIISATVETTPAGLVSEGVTKLVSAIVEKVDGTKVPVVAEDSAAMKAATECVGYCGP